ncbi:hypothetical protein ASF99_09245 [Exiguobacterium sp. Leaf187]|uniref:immunoglobulin-like domain-containing protein n=1 Tax=Exiguobacterium sp. Leaf187 TaxID=1736294 RepID=UPI000701B38A|nr:immunoglobulin-like domain-containing protein [Exiguobacterium sp. Leaf187]KQS20059.1 hypothetical protein ASF99_09245 [Exiguobacterium sp. Leaf187]
MKKGLAIVLSLLLILSYGLTPLGASAASSSSVKTVYSPKYLVHYGGVKYAKKKLTYPKSVKVKLSNGKYAYRSVKWSKVSFDKKYIGKKQKIKGDVYGTSKNAYWYVKVKNYPAKVLAPNVMTVGKNQPANLPTRLSTIFEGGQRYSYPLKWSKVSTASFGTKNLTYSTVGRNLEIYGAAKLKVSDVVQSMQKYYLVSYGKKIRATGKILYEAKGMKSYLVITDKKTGESTKMYLKLDKKGHYYVTSQELAPGDYTVYILSGSKKTKSVTITIKKPITEPTDEQKRELLQKLLLVINVSNPLLSDIEFPEVDGVSFAVDSDNSAVSSSGKVTRGATDQTVNFAIKATFGGVTESKSFSNILVPRKDLSDEELIDFTLQNFTIANPLKTNITLPTAEGISFSLISSNEAVVSSNGIVKRGMEDKQVDLTLRATKGSLTKTKSFPNILVPKVDNATDSLLQDYLDKLDIKSPVTKNIVLPALPGATVSITSTKPSVISDTGVVTRGMTDQTVSIVVSVTKDGITKSRDFWNLTVPKQDATTDELLDLYLSGLTISSPLTTNLSLTPPAGVNLSISASDPNILSNSGILTPPDVDKTISVTVNVSKDGITKSRTFTNILVPLSLSAELDAALNAINLNLLNLTGNVNLPSSSKGIAVQWTSNNPDVISNDGVVKGALNLQNFTLKASVTKGGITKTKTFAGTVAANLGLSFKNDIAKIKSSVGTLNVGYNLNLPTSLNGSAVTWTSSAPSLLSSTGAILNDSSSTPFTLTATSGGTSETLNLAIQRPNGGLLGGLLDLLGDVLKPVLNGLTGNQDTVTLPDKYGGIGLLGIGERKITGWSSSHPDLVTIQGNNLTLKRDDYDHVVVLYANFEGFSNPVPIIIKVSKR